MNFSTPPKPVWAHTTGSSKPLSQVDQIVQDPQNPSRWYATGGSAPVVSNDPDNSGANWTYVPNNSGLAAVVTWRVTFAGGNQNVALIPGADKGAIVVTDKGVSGNAAYCSDADFGVLMTVHEVMSSKDGQTLVAAGVEQSGGENRIVKSSNGGKDWQLLDLSTSGLPLNSEGVVRSAMNPNNPQDFLVLLGSGGPNSNPGMWRTLDGGAHFTKVNGLDGLAETGSRYHANLCYLEVDPREPNRRYLTIKSNLYRSIDNGQNWTGPTQPYNDWIHDLSVNDKVAGQLWAAGSLRGLRKSSNYGDSWEVVPNFTWAKSVDAVGSRIAVYGMRTGDLWPKIYFSPDNGVTWVEASGEGHRYTNTNQVSVDPWAAGKVWVSGISAHVITGLPGDPAALPVITNFTPTSGKVGTTVVITGKNFREVSSLTFNGTPVTTYTVNSLTKITAKVPVGATTGKIRIKAWGGSTSSASDFVVPEAIAPLVSISTPTVNQKFTIDEFTASRITGTASDNVALAGVTLRLYRHRNGVNYVWNGTNFVAVPPATATTHATTLTSTSATAGTWSFNTPLPTASDLDLGLYIAQAYATDSVGNVGTARVGFTLISTDKQPPVVSLSSPTVNQKVLMSDFASGKVQVTGEATDDTGVTTVRVRLSRRRSSSATTTATYYWNGTSFVTNSASFVTATLTGAGTPSATWKWDTAVPRVGLLDSGIYTVRASALDAAGNISASVERHFQIGSEFVAPTVSISSPTLNQQIDINAFGAGTVRGAATDNTGVTGVKVRLQRSRNGSLTYWNGSDWVPTLSQVDAVVSTYGGRSVTWSLNGNQPSPQNLDAGAYTVYAFAYDAVGNRTFVSRDFSITSNLSNNVSAAVASGSASGS
jgi:hypothetical protein